MLDLKKVIGSEPTKYEYLRGGTLVNVLAEEVEMEESTQWEYWQMFTTETNETKLETLATSMVEQINKQIKEEALNSVTVKVSGKEFDGRAKDQVNIMAAIQAAELLGQTSTEWKLADNTLYTVTVDELKQVLALSIQRVGQIVKGEV